MVVAKIKDKDKLDSTGSKREYIVQKEILEYLHTPRLKDVCYVWRNQSTGVFDPISGTFRMNKGLGRINGVADILGILGSASIGADGSLGLGRLLAIEVKSSKGKPTPDQASFLLQVNNRGGLGFIARSVEDVEAVFKREGVL